MGMTINTNSREGFKSKIWIGALLITVALLAGCGAESQAGIRISNPDDAEVPFSGYYATNITDSASVDGVTRASYKVQVLNEGDRVRAAFVKTDSTDSTSELNVKLYLAGKRDEASVTIPGDTAFIEYEVK
jgi:hypothetical protein